MYVRPDRPGLPGVGCFRLLFISLKLIFLRRLPLMLPLMLPRMLRSGLLRPDGSASSALILSARGFTIGGLDCIFAPAVKLRSSRKCSLSAANLKRALSKSKSGTTFPSLTADVGVAGPALLPVMLEGRIVALLLLLFVAPSASSEVLKENRASLDSLDIRLFELWREWRAVILRESLIDSVPSCSSSAIVDST